jgi:hypothetical protein
MMFREGKELSMKARMALLLFAVTMTVATCSGDETQASAIFQKVIATYHTTDTYSAEGTITSDLDSGKVVTKIVTSFSMKLKKPNQYLISWEQQNEMMPSFTQSGAVWNDGTQSYLYMGTMKAYSKMTSDEMALAGATGISGGAAYTIPSLFLNAFKQQPAPFSRLVDPKLENNEPVEGDDCNVIGGSSTISKRETFWISKQTYLIRKCARSFEPPEGGTKLRTMTDQQLEESIKAMGQEVTAERKEAMRKVMKQAEDTMKTANLKGTSTEIHPKVATPRLTEADSH